MLISCLCQQYLKVDGKCRKKGRRSSFSFRSSFSLDHLEFSLKRYQFFTFVWCFLSSMGTKMKGIYKGFKYISQIFVVKEHEMEIGHPTDVKHVAHIGWDGPSGSTPGWMNEFKTRPDFASTSIEFGESMGQQPSTELRALPKKHKRKKNKSSSSPRSGSSSRSSRAARSKSKFIEGNAKPGNIEVA